MDNNNLREDYLQERREFQAYERLAKQKRKEIIAPIILAIVIFIIFVAWVIYMLL